MTRSAVRISRKLNAGNAVACTGLIASAMLSALTSTEELSNKSPEQTENPVQEAPVKSQNQQAPKEVADVQTTSIQTDPVAEVPLANDQATSVPDVQATPVPDVQATPNVQEASKVMSEVIETHIKVPGESKGQISVITNENGKVTVTTRDMTQEEILASQANLDETCRRSEKMLARSMKYLRKLHRMAFRDPFFAFW